MNKICGLIYDISPHSFFMLFSSVISLHQHGGRGRSPCFTQSPPDRRARRAGRRSRRARRARASAGSASRAEPVQGENLCKRHASKRGFGAGEVSPRRDAGAEQPRIWNYIIIKDTILYPQGESSQGERVTVTPETKLADASPGAPYISEPESTRVPSS